MRVTLRGLGCLVLSLVILSGVGFSAVDMKTKLVMYREKVQAAAKLVEKVGFAKAEPKFLDQKGSFFFDGDQGYIFIIDTKGNTHLNAAKPALKGKNLLGVKDIKGFMFFNGFIKMGLKYGEGWVAYWWPKPGSTEASAKVSYVKLVKKDGLEYVIGAGPYDITIEDIYRLFPEEVKKPL